MTENLCSPDCWRYGNKKKGLITSEAQEATFNWQVKRFLVLFSKLKRQICVIPVWWCRLNGSDLKALGLFEGSGVGNCVIIDSHYRGGGVTGTWEKHEKNVKQLLSSHWGRTGATN